MHLFDLETKSPKTFDAQLVSPVTVHGDYFCALKFYLEENPADIKFPLQNLTYCFGFENSFCCHFIYYPKTSLGLKSSAKANQTEKRFHILRATATHRPAIQGGLQRTYILLMLLQ